MLTLPDFKEKKVILIQPEKNIQNQLKFWNSNIRLYKDGIFVNQISCYQVLSIFIIGHVTLTSILIEKAKKYGISFFLLNYSFRTYAEINSVAEGNYALRHTQYTDTEKNKFNQAKQLITNKINNQIKLLNQYDKNQAKKIQNQSVQQTEQASNVDTLRGIEGSASSLYFQSLFGKYNWYRRAPQTKEDTTNLLMDIGYTFLFNYVDSLLRLFGFDTYKGFYHTLFFQRRSLACDMMEPMRPLIDKHIIKAYNLRQINEKDFVFKNGSFNMKPKSEIRKKYTSIFFKAITDNKENMYKYVRQYYLHIMKPDKYTFPLFNL